MPVLKLDRRRAEEDVHDRGSPWKWVAVAELGGRRSLFEDLIRRGWIDSDGNGHVRLVDGALPEPVVHALARLD